MKKIILPILVVSLSIAFVSLPITKISADWTGYTNWTWSSEAWYQKYLNEWIKTKIRSSIKKFAERMKQKYPNDKERKEKIQKIKKLLERIAEQKHWLVKYVIQYMISLL